MKQKSYIATTLAGLEEVLAEELAELGASYTEVRRRAVYFEADLPVVYRINYEARTVFRVLEPLRRFEAHEANDLYKGMQKVDWRKYMDVDQTLAIDCVAKSKVFRHNKYAALLGKDAIADQFRRYYKRRPSVDVENPDLRVHIHIHEESCTVLRDASGDGLHRRGYRQQGGRAPLNEVLAAGILRLTGYKGDVPFVDFMCGSGTLLIEAAAIASKRPSQRLRQHFGFMRWPDFEEEIWQEVVRKAKAAAIDPPRPVLGSDHDRKALDIAKRNLTRAGLAPYVSLRLRDFTQLPPPPPGPGIVVVNPPYDRRIKTKDLYDLYKKMGDTFKQQYTGYKAYVFSANREALKHIGLRPSQRIPLFNGPLEARLVEFELF